MAEQTFEDLLAVLDPETRARVQAGELDVSPGKSPARPVLVDSVTKQLVKGTGHRPGGDHGNLGKMSQEYGYKRRKGYREALETLIPADEDPSVKGSLGWLLNKLFEGVEGGPVFISAVCPECDHKFKVEGWKRIDTYAIIKAVELVHGRAKETQDINLNAKHLHELLDERVTKKEITVHTLTPEEAARRKNVVEGEYKELDAG